MKSCAIGPVGSSPNWRNAATPKRWNASPRTVGTCGRLWANRPGAGCCPAIPTALPLPEHAHVLMPAMLRDRAMLGIFALPHLCHVVAMMTGDGLNRFAVFRRTLCKNFGVSKIVAHLISGKDFWGHKPRADIPAVITQHEFIEASFARVPISLRWNEDWFSRSTSRSTINKRVNATAVENLDIRHLP